MSDVTPEPQQSSPSPAVPMAFVERRRRWRPSVVWLIPVIAALVGGWLAIKAVINQGPTITISFNSAEGLEAGQTEIKFKDVDIGTIKSVRLSRDRTKVIVTAEVTKQAESLMVDDTKFWIVKPRIVGSGVSGLTTLLSGAYVALAVGKSSQERRDFVGLEEPPVVTDGPGRTFTIKANDLGSVGYGTPVYFRRIEAGEVVAYHLDKDGQGVSIEVFIHAPYDKYVTEDTRFWSASGFDISLGATGVKVNAESLAAVILGGLAFGTPPEVVNSTPARVDSTFTLFPSREEALKRQDSRVENYVLVFRESVHGLAVGAPVEFRGIPIGEVLDIGVDYDPSAKQINVPVLVRLYPDRLVSRLRKSRRIPSPDQQKKEFEDMVNNGLRAQLRIASLLTGQLYVALDFLPNAGKVKLDWSKSPLEIPTAPGDLQELQTTITRIASKIDKIPFEQLADDLRTTMHSLDTTLRSTNALVQKLGDEVTPEIKQTLSAAQQTLDSANRVLSQDSPAQQDLRDALREVARAAESVRTLTEYLDKHPESLIRGKQSENKQ